MFTVTSAADDPSVPIPGVVTLRDAIIAVNSDTTDNASSPDVINFNITGTPTINLLADLPAINNPVTIDGSMQAGVTVNGNTFAMLVDNSAATLNDVTFTGGTVTLGANAQLTVDAGSTVSVAGDLDAGNSAILNNDGSLSVSGNFVGSDSTGVYNAPFSTSSATFAASFTVGGAFTAGADSFVYNNGTATFSVTQDFTLGDGGFVYNGEFSTDAATFTVGGSFSIGANGFAYNYGASALKATGDFTLGDGGFVYNGVSSTDAATLTVGGNLSISDGGFSFVYNYGASAINVTGDFTLGGFLYNGVSSTDAATLTVGGSLSVGADGGWWTYNYGTSSIKVTGDFTLDGFLYNGVSSTDDATLTVGGTLSISRGVCL